ncbi:hypothetical protein UFOVP460_23 [uncultured Caudovirales phage]|uniref:Uncharacterized protein n=1 Tax=uncultured Caudovirales phage TaxID=2100421 RepID=A0A6J5MFW4_9CAUD|nr:hypothetical protein UFOVP460_23 [uncultured Caudovirales phage]
MSTSDLITKIDLYFNDGSVKTLVGQDRFLGIRDALKAQSQANELLCKQAELMENTIRRLQSENACLKSEVERLHETGNAMAEWLNEQGNYGGLTDKWPKPFQNPLP